MIMIDYNCLYLPAEKGFVWQCSLDWPILRQESHFDYGHTFCLYWSVFLVFIKIIYIMASTQRDPAVSKQSPFC